MSPDREERLRLASKPGLTYVSEVVAEFAPEPNAKTAVLVSPAEPWSERPIAHARKLQELIAAQSPGISPATKTKPDTVPALARG